MDSQNGSNDFVKKFQIGLHTRGFVLGPNQTQNSSSTKNRI